MNVTVQTQPIVQILGPHSVKKPLNSDIQLICHVENADKMQWVAPNHTTVMEQAVYGSYDGMFDVKNVTEGSWTCVGLRGSYRSMYPARRTIAVITSMVVEEAISNGGMFDAKNVTEDVLNI